MLVWSALMRQGAMVAGAMSRAAASAAVTDLGWRYVLGAFVTTVPVPSLEAAGADRRPGSRVGGRDGRLITYASTCARIGS